jgi:membrane-bound serine protease (ClpP class)
MDVVIIIALFAAALLLVELLLPTGGVLAVLGAAGFIAAGIVALNENTDASDYIGPALITLGVLSLGAFFIITPKILRSQRGEKAKTGREDLIGREAEVREPLDPVGQVYIEGALWKAQIQNDGDPVRPGNRVKIEKIDGLTLLVRPVESTQSETKE